MRQYGACANNVTVPSFHGIEDADRLGGARKSDRCALQRNGRLGKKKEGGFSVLKGVGSGFFCCFHDGEVVLCFIDAASVHFKKNQGFKFHQTADRPEDALPDRSQGHQTFNIRVYGLIFPDFETELQYPIFFSDFRKQKQKQRKPTAEN